MFSTKSSTDKSEDLIEDFMEKTDDILKEIEMCFVDPDDGKNGILNQSLYPESFLQFHSFNDSVVNVSDAKSPRFTPLKTIVEDSPNNIVLTDGTDIENVHFNDDALRERISTLEKDIEVYRKSILDFESENELKDEQIVRFKDKVEVQERIIVNLKDELTLLVEKESASNSNVIVKCNDSSSQTEHELFNVILNCNDVTLVDCCTQTLDEQLNVLPNNNAELVENSSQTESPPFVNGHAQTESLTFVNCDSQTESLACLNGQSQTELLAFVDSCSQTVFEICDNISSKNVECSDYYSQTEDLLNVSSMEDEKILFNCSTQTSEELFKFLPNITTQENASQTISLSAIEPLCDKPLANQCTQTIYSSFDVLPNINTVSTPADCLFEFNNSERNDLPNPNVDDARNADTKQDINVINKNSDAEDDQEVKTQSEMKAHIKVTLNDLIELRIFALEFMKREMKNFLGDIEFFENSESSSLLDQIKIEITALKELLMRLEFFIKYQNEHNEHFNTILEENNFEKFALKEQLDKLESNVKEKDAEYISFGTALLDMETTVSEFVQNISNNENLSTVEPLLKWSETNYSFIDKRTPISHIKSLQKMILSMDSFLNKKISSMVNLPIKLKETEDKLKQLKEKNQIPLKISKYVQTLDENRLLQVANKLEEADVCIEDLKKEINNLTSKLETIYNEKKILEDSLKVSNIKIKELSDAIDVEKLSWTENTMECVKRVEAKCEQMMVEQENKFFDDINKLKLEQRIQLLEKSKSYRAEQEEWKNKMEDLKKEHQLNLTEMSDKLGKEVEERYCEKFKLETEIRSLEDSLRNVKQQNSIMKEKYRKYSAEFHKLKAKLNKSVQEKETQTKDEAAKIKHNPIYIPSENSKPCHNCAVLKQQISDMQKTQQKESSGVVMETEASNKFKEIYDLKADLSSLKKNNSSLVKENMALKQDLSCKLALLRSCRCRLNPEHINDNPDVFQNAVARKEKSHESDQEEDKCSEVRKEILTNPTDILNNEIVRRAIEEAKLQERAVLNSGSGPDGTVKCHYLMRKLNKKEKELQQTKKELESLKHKPLKKQTVEKDPVETSENQHNNAFGERFENKKFTAKIKSVHPFPGGEIPKVPPKKILKEINTVVGTSNQDNVAQDPTEKKDIMCENKTKDQEELYPQGNKVNDREEKRKRQIAMLTGAPECKQQ